MLVSQLWFVKVVCCKYLSIYEVYLKYIAFLQTFRLVMFKPISPSFDMKLINAFNQREY